MINVVLEKEARKIVRIYANSKYPCEQKGNIIYDSQIIPNLGFAEEMPKKLECLYALVAFRPSHIFLSRDVLGGKPIYYDSMGISSFKNLLEKPRGVLPGEIVKLDYSGEIIEKRRFFLSEVIKKEDLSYEEAKERILKSLSRIRFKNACIAFSGGLDSSLLASLHDLPLISVTANKEEKNWILESAKKISREVEILNIVEKEIISVTPNVVKIIEDNNFLQLSVAVPLYLLFDFAKKLGFSEIILGQGADELFGGYKRYEKIEYEELETILLKELSEIGDKNLVRDFKLSYATEMKLILPYLTWDVIRAAISVPAREKIKEIDGCKVRKYFLRDIASNFLPEEIVWREKKAIQYSTGVAKILKKWFSQTTRVHGF
ncbi:MAG: asparagine synthase-related protein [Archaeoglobaceae archaeon]|nr:asparagine synthase-related protein [Archaeoglobaceae archaeon]MDW7989149.1 asparagine synthase-related protein [Archaeoglobaceae archaeon]